MAKYVDNAGLARFWDNIKGRPVRAFATVAEMQAATDLGAGMTCHTNGFHSAGDGGAAYYVVGASGTANGMDVLALQDSLLATLVVTEPYVTPEMFGAYGDGNHDDTMVLGYTLNNVPTVELNGVYLVSSTLSITASKMQGNGTLRAASAVAYMLETTNDIAIDGITFDSDNISRGAVHCSGSGFVSISNCEFTGYSAESGHASTDSLLWLNNVARSFVSDCRFHDSGYSYGTSADTLNRCITNDGSSAGTIQCVNTSFDTVNQGIVSTGIVVVSNCTFKGCSDNCLYLFKSGNIDNCYIDSSEEGIIIKGERYLISNSKISTNSIAVSFNGDCTCELANCVFESAGHTFISSRDASYSTKLNAVNCRFASTGTLTSGYGTAIACLGAGPYSFDNCEISYETCTNIIYVSNNTKINVANSVLSAASATRIINVNTNSTFVNCELPNVGTIGIGTGIYVAASAVSSGYSPIFIVKNTRNMLVNFTVSAGASIANPCYTGLPKIPSQQTFTTPAGNTFNYRVDGSIKLTSTAISEAISVVISY